MRLLGLLGLCVELGCGRVEAEEEPLSISDTTGAPKSTPEPSDDTPRDPQCLDTAGDIPLLPSLELPASIRRDAPDALTYTTDGLMEDPAPSEVTVTIALGSEAPSAVSLKLGSLYDLSCGAPEAKFSISTIEILEGDARVRQTEDAVLSVEVEEAGDSLVHVSGVRVVAAGGACSDEALEIPLVYSLLIQAETFEWSVEPEEGCPLVVASGRPLPVTVRARDAAGQIRYPVNLTRPALSVSTTDGLRLKSPEESTDSLSSVMPVGSGTVTVSLADGSSSVDVRVLAEDKLDDVFLSYSLSGIVTRGDLPLDNEGSYTFFGLAPKLDVRARWVGFEGMWLCGAPFAGDFWITSLTPEVCPVESRICEREDGSTIGSWLYESIPIIANGTCTLQIEAPDFSGGLGLSEQFSVNLANKDW